jgi:DNA polymerase/3'-5' exonuclease PolX
MMKAETVRFTATLPLAYIGELKEMAKEKKIPSVNFAINEALSEYIRTRKAERYESLLIEAGQDKSFLARTASCADDFRDIDSEVAGTW